MHIQSWLKGLTGPLAVLGLGALLTACGGSGTPTVAHIGSTTTTAAATGGGAGHAPSLTQATNYADCMRAHGVGDFPDPTPGPLGGYGFKFTSGGPNSGSASNGPNPSSASFQAADKVCRKDLPNNGVGPQLTAAQQQAFLNWAACIRTHGMPTFPDPQFSGGGVRIRISAPAGAANGAAPSGPPPALQAAMSACKSKLPGGFAGIGG